MSMEIVFNLAYPAAIWGLVTAMARQDARLGEDHRPLRPVFLAAFGLLALGDTGHVGFRVVAIARGDSRSR